MKEFLTYAVFMVAIVGVIWTLLWGFSGVVKDWEVVEPEPGVHCIVVSRMLNTSTDCWEVDIEDS